MNRAISGLVASALVLSVGVRAARAEKPKKAVVEQFSGLTLENIPDKYFVDVVNNGSNDGTFVPAVNYVP